KPTDFDFLKVIGKGSFGKVLLAKHKSDGKIFAIKVLEKKMILKRNETRHIMSERNVLLEATQHPFLVTLHYSFQTSDKLYFVLDFINGGELFFHLQRERYFPESRAQFYAAEMATALGYLHQTGIVYRDLKPENILLKFDGHIVLTDFGLCKEGIYSDNKTSTFCGTPEYLAPEVLRKQPYTKAVDWWCFGSVLYEMVYGLPPFYSRDTPEMYDNILNKPIRLRTNISVAARDILLKLLQKNPDMRLGSSDADVVEICEHEFFKSIKWSDLVEKRIPPPYIPDVQDRMDLKNIDPEFTREPVPASIRVQRNTVSASVMDADNAFEGFSYRPPMDEF
uniref:Non-specific serine/threonine protein kinase n=1 Tax=Strigamia maritima TaxID=126957 RepID=T1JKP5_STRMM